MLGETGFHTDEAYQLEDLINIDDLRALLDHSYRIAPFPVAVLNTRGEVLLASHWEPVCTQFHRVNPETAAKCAKSDVHFNAELIKGNNGHILYRCGNGLYDAASPIIIKGQHLGNLFVGQFLLEPPDEAFFRKQAKQYGFDEEVYLKVLSKVQVMSEADLKNRLDYLIGFARFLGNIGIKEIQRDSAEEALRASEEKYRLLIENATDAIYIAQDGVLKFANPRAEMISGYSARELLKIPFIEIIHPEDREMVLERHLRRLKGEKFSQIYAFRILNKSGKELSVEINAVQIHWEGKPATINFMRDITEQKNLETQLQQARKMEAIGTLAGGVAHDFNNLLMAIQGRASILLMDKDPSHPDFEHLKGIESHVASAADLTHQLLGFARGGKYEAKTLDLNALIEDSSAMFLRTKKEISCATQFQENIWLVEADKGQMDQVLMNLFVNAWHAMPKGGDLCLRTENMHLDEEYSKPFSVRPGRYVRISVTDTGVGMDKKTLEKIFDPFFTTKEMGRGTGLGLATVYGIVKNHGGFINVHSERAKGTTFDVYLPASEREILAEEESAGEILRGTETVLLVDDEEMVTEVAQQMLKRLGYKVLIAESGKNAILAYEQKQTRIDLVILDMIMPGMSGSDTFDILKEIDPDVKVLLSSGYSIDGQATQILNRGCVGFIQKPFNIKGLSQKLREVFEGGQDPANAPSPVRAPVPPV